MVPEMGTDRRGEQAFEGQVNAPVDRHDDPDPVFATAADPVSARR